VEISPKHYKTDIVTMEVVVVVVVEMNII